MVGGEAANTKFLVFCSTRQGLEHKIYHTRGESANHYTTDAAELLIDDISAKNPTNTNFN
jgi:hypothetical protein